MILTRVIRQFLTAPAVVEELAADFMFPLVTMGTHVVLAPVGRPLRVVSVILRPRADEGEPAPQPSSRSPSTSRRCASRLRERMDGSRWPGCPTTKGDSAKYFRRPNDLGGMSRCAPLCLGRPAARGYAEVALLHAAHDSIEAARRRLDR